MSKKNKFQINIVQYFITGGGFLLYTAILFIYIVHYIYNALKFLHSFHQHYNVPDAVR